ncbi:MAG: hypothetical protein LBT38_10780, partial [Deltaproteobacteria bacterium]|nr:hypothetical protein [Deltaproteobacteria bacterium]
MSYTLELPDRLKSPPPQAWTLGVIFLLGWSFSLIILPFYSRLASLWPPGSMGPIIFLDLALLAMGIGGLWWGDAVKGESAATAPLLALTLMGGAIFFLLAPCLLPALPLEKELNSGLASFFRQRIWLALLVLTPGFFLWGAAPPFLTALAFPQDRGLSTGIFPLCGLTLVALALGALESLWRPQNPSIWMSRLIGWPSIPILIVGIWLWLKTPPENRENLPFW